MSTEPGRTGAQNRKDQLRERLIAAAERAIARGGLSALKARDVATEAGCALGAIYTVFADIDGLILSVNARTLARLEATLLAGEHQTGAEELQRLARAYLNYARTESPRWRALFDHRLPQPDVPDWYGAARDRLFSRLERPLSALLPNEPPELLRARARTLFSAVHGVVTLGLDEKLAPMAAETLDAELAQFIDTIVRGLRAG
jgi:AcrR family transcriptional regulator